MALIQDICYEAVLKYGSRTAFDSLNDQTTFDRLWERVSYIAGALSDLGLRKGERVSEFYPI
jgi:non-ribosomal peptide synthetase component E (peptide arylation enzyme)